MRLWLDPIPTNHRPMALAALAIGDVTGFLCRASNNERSLDLVVRNIDVLRAAGIYEKALLKAFAATRGNNATWSLRELHRLFRIADRERLIQAGDPLPEGQRFTLYRGVAGRGPARRVRGLSWTASREQADWFAQRAGSCGFCDPATYCTTVDRSDVYAYTNGRQEQEIILLLAASARVRRLAAQ